jgi:hypothetical protein
MMKTERTNFQGEWGSICPHCGGKEIEHRTTYGPIDDVLYEHRLPCEPEKDKMLREIRRKVRTTQAIVFIGWIFVPLVILVLGVTSPLIGWIAFTFAIWRIVVEAIKLFGNPDKWIPGHKEKMERERKMKHYFYHCEQNPEGFARLRAENFEEQLEGEERSNQASEATSGPAPGASSEAPQG